MALTTLFGQINGKDQIKLLFLKTRTKLRQKKT